MGEADAADKQKTAQFSASLDGPRVYSQSPLHPTGYSIPHLPNKVKPNKLGSTPPVGGAFHIGGTFKPPVAPPLFDFRPESQYTMYA
jgi:hypothetical protein